jgi:putative FmdB family regulatory protein
MPLYEYYCATCDVTFEVIQKFSDSPVETCQKCGSQVTKLLSSPAIQFKGAGWYINDYSRKGGAPAESTATPQKNAAPDAAATTAGAKETVEAKAKPSESASKDAPAAEKKDGSKAPVTS